MITVENECVGCPPEMGCMGSACPHRNAVYQICDECDDCVDVLYDVGGKQLCAECALNTLPLIDPRDFV